MKITPDPIHISQMASAQKTKPAAKTEGQKFGENLIAKANTSAPVTGVHITPGILAVQEVSNNEHRRKQAFKRGNALLDILEDMRKELLYGAPSLHRLDQLKSILHSHIQKTDEPELQDILSQIELRAAVEIAKRER